MKNANSTERMTLKATESADKVHRGAVLENQSPRCAAVNRRGRRRYNATPHNSGHTKREVEVP